MLRLTIKKIDRYSGQATFTYMFYYFNVEECLKTIRKLDKKFQKEFFKFQYIIEEEK